MNRTTERGLRIVLRYGLVWLVLMGLFGATFATAFIPLGPGGTILHIGIALLQIVILWLVFMDLIKASAAVRLAAAVGAVWLIFLFGLTMNDYLTRPWNGSGTAMTPRPARIGEGAAGGYPKQRLPLDRRLTPYDHLIPPVPPNGPAQP